MTELETLIDQQRREMRRPWRTYHWSKRSVQARISLDVVVGPSIAGTSLTLADVLVEGETAWFPWAFAPAVPTHVEPGDAQLGISDALTVEETARYRSEWPQR